MAQQHFSQHASRAHPSAVNFKLFAAGEAEINEQLELLAVSRVANRFVVEFRNATREAFGQRRSPAGSLKGFHLIERRGKLKPLDFRHRINFDELSLTNHPRPLDVFLTLQFEHEAGLSVKRR